MDYTYYKRKLIHCEDVAIVFNRVAEILDQLGELWLVMVEHEFLCGQCLGE